MGCIFYRRCIFILILIFYNAFNFLLRIRREKEIEKPKKPGALFLPRGAHDYSAVRVSGAVHAPARAGPHFTRCRTSRTTRSTRHTLPHQPYTPPHHKPYTPPHHKPHPTYRTPHSTLHTPYYAFRTHTQHTSPAARPPHRRGKPARPRKPARREVAEGKPRARLLSRLCGFQPFSAGPT
jgi:hypothetical protein